MTSAIHSEHDFERLRRDVSGPLVRPGEPGWDSARQAWNLAVDQQPAAVAYPSRVDDVISIVSFARAHGLRLAAQGTGHAAATLELDDTILVKTIRMTGVEIDPAARSARVAPGALWGEVAVRAGEHGLAGLAGSAADVGVVGYTLGGGLGWLGRRYGLASNSVRAVELVTAAGDHIRADRQHEPELFWALRGGGGAFGIVTALEFELYPVSAVFAGALAWPAEHAEALLERYQEWTQGLPETASSIFRLLNAPPLPSVPEPLRGRAVVTVDVAYLGGASDGIDVLRPMREVARPLLDAFDMLPATALTALHGDPEMPVPGIGEGFLVRELGPAAAGAFLEVGGPESESPLISLELRHLGGALATAPPGHGALPRLEGVYALYGVGSPTDAEHSAAIHTHLDAIADAMAPYASHQTYLNFADRTADPRGAFDVDTYHRLRSVKATYDPEDLIRSNHPIAPAQPIG